MKQANRIRLICIISALGCCLAYGGGYYYSIQSKEEQAPRLAVYGRGQASEETLPETAQSSAILSAYEFVLCAKDGYVIVYCADGETVYDTTDIRIEELPELLQKEIAAGKQISSERELYNFLESYSS